MAKRGENLKGKKQPGSGMKKGHKIAKTVAWEQLGDFLTEKGAERVSLMLQTADPADFFKYYCLLLEYFKPKLQRSEITAQVAAVTAQDIINKLKED